jgi:hypothetical protein
VQTERLFASALNDPAKEKEIRLLVGLMLDALRTRSSDTTSIFIEMLIDNLANEWDDETDQDEHRRRLGIPDMLSAAAFAWTVKRIIRLPVASSSRLVERCNVASSMTCTPRDAYSGSATTPKSF